jgi:hypothetical protein
MPINLQGNAKRRQWHMARVAFVSFIKGFPKGFDQASMETAPLLTHLEHLLQVCSSLPVPRFPCCCSDPPLQES